MADSNTTKVDRERVHGERGRELIFVHRLRRSGRWVSLTRIGHLCCWSVFRAVVLNSAQEVYFVMT